MDENPQNENIDDAFKDAGKNFSIFITGLSMQALICMGEMPNPVDQKKSVNLKHAKFTIDTLEMVKDKTKGNLASDEEKLLEDILYGLRMKYLELDTKQGKP